MTDLANKMRAEVSLCLGGKDFVLRYTADAVHALEDSMDGTSFFHIMRNYERYLTLGFLSKAVRAGMRYDQRLNKYTERWIMAHLDSDNLALVAARVIEGLAAWLNAGQQPSEEEAPIENDPLG